MKHKLFGMLAFLISLSLLAGASWAVPPVQIEVLGNHWNPSPGRTTLCAEVCPHTPGLVLEFIGENQFGIKMKAKPKKIEAKRISCINTVWPQGIYGVKACLVKPTSGGTSSASTSVNGVPCSPMVAISVYNPKGFCGSQGGGALHLRSYGVPPNVKKTLAEREASYAYIYKTSPPWNFGIGYFDNDNPNGKVSFVAVQWFDAKCDEMTGPDHTKFEVMGMGWAEMGLWQGPVRYKMSADDYPGENWFRLQLWSISGALIYQSAPDEQSSEQRVYDGKNVFVHCDNDGWPCGGGDGCR